MDPDQLKREFEDALKDAEENFMSSESQADRAVIWLKRKYGDKFSPEIEVEVRRRYTD
jgi:hypothetical protein